MTGLSETPTVVPRPQPSEGHSASSLKLPSDLLQKSRGRVRLVALLILLGVGSEVVLGLIDWVASERSSAALMEGLRGASGNFVGIALSAAMVAIATMRRWSDRTVLVAGLVFEVSICMMVSIANPLAVWNKTGSLPGLTWITPLIIMFPLLVPNRPIWTLAVSLVCAATAPLGLLLLASQGLIEATGGDYAVSLVAPVTGAVFAYVGSRVLYGLALQVSEGRRELEREREMGSYRLESLLGRGGMGEVWKARHRMLVRPAALKLIRPEALGGDDASRSRTMDRFRREAQATASMCSPHTIEVHDFGLTDEGTFYYVMELLDGVDAETLVKRFGPLPPGRAVRLLAQVCHSLGEAHEHGLIHRDIKPANLFVCRYGRERDFVKVLDFGLVKASAADADREALTREHSIVGTPAFMAPEQVVGHDSVDARTDLYALGCVAYWLLTGELVFSADSASKLLMAQVRDTPVAPSARCETPIPKALDDIVLRCLAKDPDDRPRDADELAAALLALPIAHEWSDAKAAAWWDMHLPQAREVS